jgi:hypothetical protein
VIHFLGPSDSVFMNQTNQSVPNKPTISYEGQIPSEETKSNIDGNGDSLPVSPIIFDPASLRIPQAAFNQKMSKKYLDEVPIWKRPKKDHFVRVHPEPEFRLCDVAIIDDEDSREIYIVHPDAVEELAGIDHDMANLYLAIDRQQTHFIWAVKLPPDDGRRYRWRTSLMAAVDHAMKTWVKVVPNQNLGAYETSKALANFPDPEWQPHTFGQFLEVATRDFLILHGDHALLKRKRGEA